MMDVEERLDVRTNMVQQLALTMANTVSMVSKLSRVDSKRPSSHDFSRHRSENSQFVTVGRKTAH